MSSFVDVVVKKSITLLHFKQIQSHLLTTGLFQTPPLRATLLLHLSSSPSSSSAHLNLALHIFNQIHAPVTDDCNSIIRGLSQSPTPSQAILFFTTIFFKSSSPKPNSLSFSFTLKACARASALSFSGQLHSHLARAGLRPDAFLHTSLLDAYSKSGDPGSARQVFDEMPAKDVVTWNALVAGLVHCRRPEEALCLFERMLRGGGPRPNSVTVVAALSACAAPETWSWGAKLHEYAVEEGYDGEVFVCNALMDMYSRCGSFSKALTMFESGMRCERNVVSWNTIITATAAHGRGEKAVEMFDSMGASGAVRDAVTYLAALSACNHSGLVEEGLRIFDSMPAGCRDARHYGAVVDMLGRAGRIKEAYEVVASMPVAADMVIWQTLLGACTIHGDVERAEAASHMLLAEMDSSNGGDFVLMSNVYAYHERWGDVGRVRDDMRRREVKKEPGMSCTEVDGVTYRFYNGLSGDPSVRGMVEEMRSRLREVGYVARTDFVLHDIGEEEKEDSLFCHSEKLALAFALAVSKGGGVIRVVKNMRICGDCHVVVKLISRVYGREIVVRDRVRFHTFQDGHCSCGDYW